MYLQGESEIGEKNVRERGVREKKGMDLNRGKKTRGTRLRRKNHSKARTPELLSV